MNEIPQISSNAVAMGLYYPSETWTDNTSYPLYQKAFDNYYNRQNYSAPTYTTNLIQLADQTQNQKQEEEMSKPCRRIVQVFIVDPDEEIPIEKALLYEGERKFTDATDQELFFEVPIKDILDKHNEFRKTVERKNEKEIRYLEPIKIRDLKMTVAEFARF